MKPIETSYAGFRFRSRLEAKWAVCFDTMDIDFRYEHEGFQLSWPLDPSKRNQRLYYLPDFYLPSLDVYAEAKASWTPAGRWRFYNIAASLDKPVLLLGDLFRVSALDVIRLPVRFIMGDVLYAGSVEPGLFREAIQVANTNGAELSSVDLLNGSPSFAGNHPTWRLGYKAAQRARFEHQESG